MKKIKFLILIIAVITSCSESSYEKYSAKIETDKFLLLPGSESYIPVKIEIPGNAYIYANPKGPGIGKPIEISAVSEGPFQIKKSRYPYGEKNTAAGETKHVFIYQKEVYIFIPVIVNNNAKNGLYPVTIDIDALLCDLTTCTPKVDKLSYMIEINSEKSETAHSEKIQSFFKETIESDILISVSNNEPINLSRKTAVDSLSNIEFKPRCLDTGITSIFQAIFFGIIAGIILNFMPCVLPVVSLKIMGFVENAAKDRREIFKLGIIFSSGIILSFTLLAVLAAFFGYNWGGLFQHRMFILAMASLVFILSMSMFNVFTLNIPAFAGKAVSSSGGNNYIDTFVKGLFATLLATPCSGPFLGGTLAWTITQPAYIIFIVFISIGFGMSLPYLIISFKPELIRFIPKPGNWMKTFESLMAFLLLFTVIYLLGILDNDSRMPAILFLGFIALGLYQYGRFGSLINSRISRILSSIVLILIIISGYLLSFEYLYSAGGKYEFKLNEYTEERLIDNRNKGIITVIKFTADWCPNCRLVEAKSIKTQKVMEIFNKEKIDFLTADITRKNPPAERMLKILGSFSIPVLAIIPPGKQFESPLCLRDIYSEKDVLKAIEIAIKERDSPISEK